MKMKKFVAAALAGCLAVSLAACGSSASDSTGSTGETAEAATEASATGAGITVQLGPNPETLDPALNSTVDGANTIITIFEPLLLIDENNEVIPGIVDAEDGTYFMDNANGGEPYISEDYEANLEEAKSLLAEAGYPNGEGFPTITYSANDSGYHIPVAEYLQTAWGELGITVNIEKVEWSSFTSQRRAGDFDISRNGWLMDYNDASNMLELFTTGNGNNDGKYSNPDFDAAIEASKVADKTEHFAKLHEAEDILMEDMGCIPVAYYNDFWLQSPSLQGTWHSPYGYWYLQYAYVAE